MTDAATPSYGLILEFAETETRETFAVADEAVRVLEQLTNVIASLGDEGVEVRGFYDLTGFSEMSSLLVWLRSDTVDNLQWAQRQLQRTDLLGDTMLLSSRLVVQLTELDEMPGGWLNLVDAVEAIHDDFADAGEIADDDLDGIVEDQADFDELQAPEVEVAEPIEPEVEDEDDDSSLPLLSLHSQLGIGEMRFVIIAEAEAPMQLIGELGQPFGDDLEFELTPPGLMGRYITASEVFEVLR